METILATIFLAALDRLLDGKLGSDEKRIVSETLAKLALDYSKGKVIATDELTPVSPMNIEEILDKRG